MVKLLKEDFYYHVCCDKPLPLRPYGRTREEYRNQLAQYYAMSDEWRDEFVRYWAEHHNELSETESIRSTMVFVTYYHNPSKTDFRDNDNIFIEKMVNDLVKSAKILKDDNPGYLSIYVTAVYDGFADNNKWLTEHEVAEYSDHNHTEVYIIPDKYLYRIYL